jgi:hypothetical protein
MELVLIGMVIAAMATGVDVYCAYCGASELPEAENSDETA